VERLRIVQGPLRAVGPAQPRAVAPGRRAKGPLDAGSEQQLDESLASLPEGRLKRALTRLGREVLRGEAR